MRKILPMTMPFTIQSIAHKPSSLGALVFTRACYKMHERNFTSPSTDIKSLFSDSADEELLNRKIVEKTIEITKPQFEEVKALAQRLIESQRSTPEPIAKREIKISHDALLTVGTVLLGMPALGNTLYNKIESVEDRLNAKIESVEAKLAAKIDSASKEHKEDIHELNKKVDLLISTIGHTKSLGEQLEKEKRILGP